MNEATTKPFEDYKVFLVPQPRFFEIYLKMLDHWQKNEFFYDLHVTKGRLEVELKLPPPPDDDRYPHVWAKIRYRSGPDQRLDPKTGVHSWFLKCDMSDVENSYARELMQTKDWEFQIVSKGTPLRGSKVGKTMIWSHTEEGLAKIATTADSIEAAGDLKRRLLAGEL
jgi:hypothetical protein